MKYRPDIDGLRAIAIILVLIYHSGFSFFPSGFIGVDVFFVISGFLITGIIHEALNEGSFSFIDFFNRRLWRLQPAFICFLLITTVITILYFLPDDLMYFSKSPRKASLFLSNLFFDKTTSGYFAPNTQQIPLLHTWSLSIEWQCYLFLPCLIYCLNRFVAKKYFKPLLLFLTFITFLNSMYYAKILPAHTYYLFSSRIFEFLIGSCIALFPSPFLLLNPFRSALIGSLALISILYLAHLQFLLPGYPNLYALIVCAATGFLICIGSFSSENFLSKFLSSKPLVFIGLLSYSLYIWHWGVFSILRYEEINETLPVLVGAMGITFILAYVSWRYIENPLRKFNHIKFHYTLVFLCIVPLVFFHLNDSIIRKNRGFPQRFHQELRAVYQYLNQYNSPQRALCITDHQYEINEQCILGSKKADSKHALMIGDSFSNQYWGFADVLGQAANVSILMQTVSSCLTLPNIYLYNWWHFKNQVYQICYDLTQKYYQMIEKNHYDYVIIGELWGSYLSSSVINKPGDTRSYLLARERVEKALDDALKMIIKSGAKPVLIKSTAFMQENFHHCFFRHIKKRKPYNPHECDFTFNDNEWFNRLFDKMKEKYTQLIIIDPKKVQCQEKKCMADIHGIPIYRDVGHITDYASYQFGMIYLKKFPNPFG